MFALQSVGDCSLGCEGWADRSKSKSMLLGSQYSANSAQTLCNNCGFLYERDRKLPKWAKDLHKIDLRAIDYR